MGEQDLSWRDLVERLQSDVAPDSSELSRPRDETAWGEARERVRRLAKLASVYLQLSLADSEDLCQGIMLDFQTTDLLRRLQGSASPAGYLLSTLRNRGRDLARYRGREHPLASEPRAPLIAEGWQASDHQESQYAALEAALRSLSDQDRELIVMRFWKGMPVGRIAEQLHEPYSRVAVRLFRIRKRLADNLGESGGRQL